jgi:hypothetical protein
MVEDVAIAPGVDAVAPLAGEQAMYIPAAQVEAQLLSLVHVWVQPSWIIRTAGPVEGLPARMQRALASADSNLPFSGFYRMRDLLAKTLTVQRVEVGLLSALAALALLLSAVGIFALVANIVAENARNRHPHRSGIHHSSSHDACWSAGSTGLGTGTHPWFDFMCGSVAGHA